MRRFLAVGLLGCATAVAQTAPIPMADEISGRPFAIQHTWVIGGVGDWDYLTLDSKAGQLFIAHEAVVQVVDLEAGKLAGTVTGFHDAHQIVLDRTGGYGYVTDGPANQVKVFDRGSFEVVASIPTGPQPRSLVLEPNSGLLLAICAGTVQDESAQPKTAPGKQAPRPRRMPSRNPQGSFSTITVIDPQARKTLANILVAGKLGFADTDGDGNVYVLVPDANRITRLDVMAMNNEIERQQKLAATPKRPAADAGRPLLLDWSGMGTTNAPPETRPFPIGIGGGCQEPHGMAVDGHNNRLFVACANMKMVVVDSNAGGTITSMTIGPGADSVAYDASRGLIFTANGGGFGSVTVIRQHLTDSYSVIQDLPSQAQARTITVDPSTGKVYLVATLYGAKLGPPPATGMGTFKMDPINGSFQVLVIGR